jgi:glutamine amidotransferase
MKSPEIVILKYNAGNIRSVMIALERLGVHTKLTNDPEELQKAEKIIFPGVGEAGTAMKSLQETGLDKIIPSLKQPFLATCVGMQLLCRHSEESNTSCLGIFDVDVKKFVSESGEKIPQTGWNNIYNYNTVLCNGLKQEAYVYYNHAYYAPLSKYTVAETNYIQSYSAILQKDNFFACQFHSEISGGVGEQIFKNFLKL